MSLSTDSLRGLAVLARHFSNGLGERVYICALIDEIISRLEPTTRRLLEPQPERFSLAVKQFVDKGEILFRVWETVQKSIDQQRKLGLQHLSPRYEDQQPIYYEVVPVHVRYPEGHWYLRAWSLLRQTSTGKVVRYRLKDMISNRESKATEKINDCSFFVTSTKLLSTLHYRCCTLYSVHQRRNYPVNRVFQ